MKKKLVNRLLDFLGLAIPCRAPSVLPVFPWAAPFFAYYTHRAIQDKVFVTCRASPDAVCAEILAALKCGCDVRYHHSLERM